MYTWFCSFGRCHSLRNILSYLVGAKV
ncbi:hypothetical protein FMN12_16150 [Bacteroides acidifaciens]|uniref:Uncharacterized protein n=1 Tax=Bacteroides acidifaciens TaxID=85831 RepID=A0A3L7Z3Z2_9BACE|nr:hypothetical protein [Bacteroides acidifaciens]RLT80794.1 hypothetical protein D7Y07_06515 [Bacteroides acidifaciens]TFU47399.1 hypothetical protein E4T97_15135 [Bacteroides acidifaciens]TGX99998.1 hypothetical protein E5356_15075 [Bacteroides acidifaciens]